MASSSSTYTAYLSSVHRLLSLVPAILLYYDYLLTLSDEIAFYWGRKRGLITSLFFFNRYAPLVGVLFYPVHNLMHLTGKVCKIFVTFDTVLILATQFVSAAILGIRTYAVYERKSQVLVILLMVYLSIVSYTAWTTTDMLVAADISTGSTDIGCATPVEERMAVRGAIVYILLFTYDAIVFFLILLKAIKSWRTGLGQLLKLIIRDGSLYFVVMLIANLACILNLLIAPPVIKDALISLSNAISVMMVSRLLFNLQSVSLGVSQKSSSDMSFSDIDTRGLPTLRFSRSYACKGARTEGVTASIDELQPTMSVNPLSRPTWARRDTDPLELGPS